MPCMVQLPQSTKSIKIGLCLAALATVLLELVMTRLFSVSAGYHFSFMIVSLAMFGLTAGALVSSFSPKEQTINATILLQKNAALLALAIPIVAYMHNRLNAQMAHMNPFLWVAVSFILFSIPFFFAGRVFCLCLTRYSDSGKLYAADLVGAALAGPILVLALTFSTPQLCLTVAGAYAVAAAICFGALDRIMSGSTLMLALLSGAVGINLTCALMPKASSIPVDTQVETVAWSPVGRVTVTSYDAPATTWAAVRLPYMSVPPTRQKGMYIDFGAFTVMTQGNATVEQMAPIKNDVTAVGNYLRPMNSLFVIGVGGGRDVLTGLIYQQRKIDGVELNPAIVDLVTKKYADFNGNLAKQPGVTIINDEARSWLANSNQKYGLIQCSLVDTWSASTSGAYMLQENVLYTKEAFDIYLKHLEPTGVLSFLRWGDEKEPAQLTRMIGIAKSALRDAGVKDVGKNMMLLTAEYREGKHRIGNLLVSLTPFSEEDCARIQTLAQEQNYSILWLPDGTKSVEPFAQYISGNGDLADIPTDDSPFFFSPAKTPLKESSIGEPAGGAGLMLLAFTLAVAAILVGAVILIPAWAKVGKYLGTAGETRASGIYFASIGLAYMMIEVGQIERLTIMLGNPTYSLSVVLFAMLLASGIGSLIAEKFASDYDARRMAITALVGAFVLCAVSNLSSRFGLVYLEPLPLVIRALVAIVLVAAPAFFMGWAFPLGMKHFSKNSPLRGSWFWAVNGALSVLGSISAAICSIMFGITVTLFVGCACYLVAIISLLGKDAQTSAAAQT